MSPFRLTFIFLLVPNALVAQECRLVLSGLVRDSQGKILPGATILLNGQGLSANAKGEFVYDKLCSASYTMSISFIGFKDYTDTIQLTENKKLVIILEQEANVLDAIEVVGKQQESLTNTSSQLSERELAHYGGKSLGEALKRVPGVSALQTGPAIFKPVIQGLHSQRILILNNGIRQEGQQWGIEHAPEVDPFIASEISVVKGSETVRYGSDAIGGVIIIDTPPLHQTRKPGGEINLGAFSNNGMGVVSGMLEGGFKKNESLSWRLQASGKKGGDFSTPDYTLSNTGVAELNFSGAMGYKTDQRGIEFYFSSFNTEIGILRAAHTGNLDDLENSIRSSEPWYVADFSYQIDNPKQRINHQLIKVSAFKRIKGAGTLHLLYGGQLNQRKEFDIRRGGRSDKPSLSLDLFSNVLDVSLEHKIGLLQGNAGVNLSLKNNSNVPGTGIRPLIPNYNQFNGGMFLIEKFRYQKWLFDAGARFDHQYLKVSTFVNNQDFITPSFNFSLISGSTGVAYHFTPTLRLTSHIGVSMRAPHVSELYSEGLHHGTASIEEGLMRQGGNVQTSSDQIRNEVSRKWITGFQMERKRFSFELSAYYNFISNYVFLKPTDTRLTIRGYFPVLQYDQTEAVFFGADGLFHWDITPQLEYSGTFAYLYAADLSRKDVLTFIPPAQMNHTITYNFKIAQLDNLFVAFSVSTAARQNRAPFTVYPSEISSYTGDNTTDFAPAPDGYTLLGLQAGFEVPIANHTLVISLQGENIANKKYRVYMNRLRYFADEPGQNFILRLKYNFHSH